MYNGGYVAVLIKDEREACEEELQARSFVMWSRSVKRVSYIDRSVVKYFASFRSRGNVVFKQ